MEQEDLKNQEQEQINQAMEQTIYGYQEQIENQMQQVESLFWQNQLEEAQDIFRHSVQKSDDLKTTQSSSLAVYRQTLSYAIEHGEMQKYKASHMLNKECKEAIEEIIQQNFDGMYLKNDIVKPLAEEYGLERMTFVLANTLQELSEDGRFSKDNKAWAAKFPIPENTMQGMDMNYELIVSSHPIVLNGFIDMFRSEVLELEKEMSARQEKVTSGHDVQKSETGQFKQKETEKNFYQKEQEMQPEKRLQKRVEEKVR